MFALAPLAPLGRAHLPDVAALTDDADVRKFTRLPIGAAAIAEWYARYEAGRVDGTREGFAILSDGFAGIAVAPRIDRLARTVELGYVVAPAARGRGLATAALRELTRWAFDLLSAMRIELLIDVANEPSRRVALRCGYILEGTMRSTYLRDDVRSDTELWSRLPSDPVRDT